MQYNLQTTAEDKDEWRYYVGLIQGVFDALWIIFLTRRLKGPSGTLSDVRRTQNFKGGDTDHTTSTPLQEQRASNLALSAMLLTADIRTRYQSSIISSLGFASGASVEGVSLNYMKGVSSWHPRGHARHSRRPRNLLRGCWACRACGATSQFSLPRAYLIGRPAVCCGVVLPVCPCVVSFSKLHEPDTHDLSGT